MIKSKTILSETSPKRYRYLKRESTDLNEIASTYDPMYYGHYPGVSGLRRSGFAPVTSGGRSDAVNSYGSFSGYGNNNYGCCCNNGLGLGAGGAIPLQTLLLFGLSGLLGGMFTLMITENGAGDLNIGGKKRKRRELFSQGKWLLHF